MALSNIFEGMKYRRAGASGLWLSEVGLGLWKWGDPSYDGSRVGDHEGFKILDQALDLGVFFWDTANSYNMASGNSERLLGRYFSSRSSEVREKVILATKITNSARPEHVMDYTFTPNQQGASRVYIINEVSRCLERLQTDYIDLLYIHSPTLNEDGNWETPLEETWSAMDDLVTQGIIHYIAVSNHSQKQVQEVLSAQKKVSKDVSRRIVTVQNRYNILERDLAASEEKGGSEKAFLDFCRKESIGIVPYFPLASGLLSGRYRKNNLDTVTGRTVDEKWLRDMFLTEDNIEKVEALVKIAEIKSISLAQLAIAWLLSHKEVCSVIAGVTKMEHLLDNSQAPMVELTKNELEKIEKIVK